MELMCVSAHHAGERQINEAFRAESGALRYTRFIGSKEPRIAVLNRWRMR
jgi:hypothetical protein